MTTFRAESWMKTPASPFRYMVLPSMRFSFEPRLSTKPASPVSRRMLSLKTLRCESSSSTPPSLSSSGLVGMPMISLPSIRWPLACCIMIASPRLPRITLLRATLFCAPARNVMPSSLSLMVLFCTVLPVRPLSASKNSTPATAFRQISRLSTTTRVEPGVIRTPQPISCTVPLRTMTFDWPLTRMPAGKPSSWPEMFPRM